jgi:hypothetical protein
MQCLMCSTADAGLKRRVGDALATCQSSLSPARSLGLASPQVHGMQRSLAPPD